MKVRIGIDVGGTFTDAVAINNDTYELIGTVKGPTTRPKRAWPRASWRCCIR